MPDFASGGRYQNGVSLASIVRIREGRKRRGLPGRADCCLARAGSLVRERMGRHSVFRFAGDCRNACVAGNRTACGRLRRSVFHGVVPVWDRTCCRFFRTVGISAVPCVVWGRDGFRNRFMPDTGHRLFEKCRFFHSGTAVAYSWWPPAWMAVVFPVSDFFPARRFHPVRPGADRRRIRGCLSVWFSPGGYMKRLRFFRCRLSVPAGRMFRIPFAFRRSRVGKALFSASACLS